jgi:hypothetical protein
LGNNPWAGDNSSIISSLLTKNSRTFKDLIIFQGLSRPGFFLNKFKDFLGLSRIFKDCGDPENLMKPSLKSSSAIYDYVKVQELDHICQIRQKANKTAKYG